jgi:hypothetical protein
MIAYLKGRIGDKTHERGFNQKGREGALRNYKLIFTVTVIKYEVLG